jgi:hypothetical protein
VAAARLLPRAIDVNEGQDSLLCQALRKDMGTWDLRVVHSKLHAAEEWQF